MYRNFQLASLSAAAALLTQNTEATGSCTKCGYTGDLSISPSEDLKWRTFTPGEDDAISVSLDHTADEDTCPVSQSKMYLELYGGYKDNADNQFEWNTDPNSWQVNLTNWDDCNEERPWVQCYPLVVTTHEDSKGRIYASSEVQLYNSEATSGWSEAEKIKQYDWRTNNWCKKHVFDSSWPYPEDHLFIFGSNSDRPADKMIQLKTHWNLACPEAVDFCHYQLTDSDGRYSQQIPTEFGGDFRPYAKFDPRTLQLTVSGSNPAKDKYSSWKLRQGPLYFKLYAPGTDQRREFQVHQCILEEKEELYLYGGPENEPKAGATYQLIELNEFEINQYWGCNPTVSSEFVSGDYDPWAEGKVDISEDGRRLVIYLDEVPAGTTIQGRYSITIQKMNARYYDFSITTQSDEVVAMIAVGDSEEAQFTSTQAAGIGALTGALAFCAAVAVSKSCKRNKNDDGFTRVSQ